MLSNLLKPLKNENVSLKPPVKFDNDSFYYGEWLRINKGTPRTLGMEEEFKFGQMVQNMKVIGFRIELIIKEGYLILMEMYMKEIF